MTLQGRQLKIRIVKKVIKIFASMMSEWRRKANADFPSLNESTLFYEFISLQFILGNQESNAETRPMRTMIDAFWATTTLPPPLAKRSVRIANALTGAPDPSRTL